MEHLIAAAVQKIRNGDVVAFPTETVYGLGANAFSNEACAKIYSIKSRPAYNPLIIHVSSLEKAMEIGDFSQDAITLAQNFWPGPLSIVVKLKAKIAIIASAGLDTVAIRIPNHEIALEFLKEVDLPIAAPSANPSNYISPTLAEHVRKHFEREGILILDGGMSNIGIESTIIDCSTEGCNKILRHGFITQEDFENKGIIIDNSESSKGIIAPGMLSKHYSPKTKVRLGVKVAQDKEIALEFGNNLIKNSVYSFNLSKLGDLKEAAQNLYSMLRSLDQYAQENDIESIAVSDIPNQGIGIAINDKLQRAAWSN